MYCYIIAIAKRAPLRGGITILTNPLSLNSYNATDVDYWNTDVLIYQFVSIDTSNRGEEGAR